MQYAEFLQERTMETLIPDFQGIHKHIDRLVEVAPEVISSQHGNRKKINQRSENSGEVRAFFRSFKIF